MAAMNYATTRRNAAGFLTRVHTVLASSIAWYVSKREEARTRRSLLALSERELNDIGLSRCDIEDLIGRDLRR